MENLLLWFSKWEPIWLFVVLCIETIVGIYTGIIVTMEYFYDAAKDEAKKQRRTRTSKKVTEQKDGAKVTEEVTEVSEPVKEESNNG